MTNAIQEKELSPGRRTASPGCTILIGKDNSYLEVSDGFCRLVGYSRDELLQMKLEDLAAPGTADITTAFNPFEKTDVRMVYDYWLVVRAPGYS